MDISGFIKRVLRRDAEPVDAPEHMPGDELTGEPPPAPEPEVPPSKPAPRILAEGEWEFQTAADAQCAVYALIIAGTEASRRPDALKLVAARDGVPLAEKTRELFKLAVHLDATDRLPYIEDALTRLKVMGTADCDKFLKLVSDLIDADKRYTLPEFTLNMILRSRLLKSQPAPAATKLGRQDVVPEMRLLLSLMARAGADNEQVAARNLSRLMFQLTGQGAELAAATELNTNHLTAALEKMRQVPSMVRETFVQTLAECVILDGKVKPMEAELLAAMAARLGVPVPPLDMTKVSRAET